MSLPVVTLAPGLHSGAQRVPAGPCACSPLDMDTIVGGLNGTPPRSARPPNPLPAALPPPPQVGVAGMLEAATLLLRQGWRPRRTLYFAFGQDEEVGGELGAGGRGRGGGGGEVGAGRWGRGGGGGHGGGVGWGWRLGRPAHWPLYHCTRPQPPRRSTSFPQLCCTLVLVRDMPSAMMPSAPPLPNPHTFITSFPPTLHHPTLFPASLLRRPHHAAAGRPRRGGGHGVRRGAVHR